MICKLCDSTKSAITRCGKIRDGKPGHYIEEATLHRCLDCGIVFLDESLMRGEDYYSSGEYRKKVEQKRTADMDIIKTNMDIFSQIAPEDPGSCVLDVGSGHGWNAQAMRMLGLGVVTIDPDPEMCPDWETLKGAGDQVTEIATAFTVIEHVENPKTFLLEIKDKLVDGGKILLSTPNLNNFNFQYSVDYRASFYCTQHNWYFDFYSLRELLVRVGFKNIFYRTKQILGLDNTFAIMSKNYKYAAPIDNPVLDFAWKNHLEEEGAADMLYMWGEK